MIPDGWSEHFLGDVCKISSGVGFPLKFQGRKDLPIPFIKVSDMNSEGNEKYVCSANNTIDSQIQEYVKAPIFPKGCLILPKVGAALLTNKRRILAQPTAVDNNVMVLMSKSVNYEFLYYWSLLIDMADYVQSGALPSINKSTISQIQITLPPEKEQKKIATILSSVDDAIQATQAVIDQTRRVKQGLLLQLLTRGIGHTQFKQTDIGVIPETWELTTLGKIANKNSLQTGPFGSQLHASEYIESGIPVVMPKDLFDGRILDDNIACVPEDVADRLMKHRLQAGDILFARRGDIGRCSLVRDSEVGWICGTGCLRARVNDKISPEFLIQFLQWPKTVKWLNENAVGQTMLNLNTQILANLPILVPPKHEQINITNIFESINDELDKLISEKSTLLSIKHGLMQDLLTGRIRVGDST